MAKLGTSLRIEEEQLEQLDRLIEHYKREQENNIDRFNIRMTRATVIEMLIRKEYNIIFLK